MSQKSLLTILQEMKRNISIVLEDRILDSSLVDQLAWQLERFLGSFNDASLLNDLTECLVSYINLVSTYSTFQADRSTKAHKQAVFKYVSVLNVLTSISRLQNLLLPTVTPLIINILCDPSITDICGMEILRFFNNVARSTDKSIRYAIGNTSPFHIHKLADTLSVCGCFEYQMLTVESIFLLCSIEQVGELSKAMFPEASSLQYAIRTLNVKEFDKSARSFLNTVNNIYRNITSIVADKVYLDKHQISEPVDANNYQHPLWVDFNKNSIGIYCKRDSLRISQSSQDSEVIGWELLTIFYKDVINTVHAKSKNVNSPATFFKFFLKNELHVMFASSTHLTSSRILTLICADEATVTKMKDEILPLISENTFEEHTQDSTESSSLVLGGSGIHCAISKVNPVDRKSISSGCVQSEKSLYEMFEVHYHSDGQADCGRQIAKAQPVPDSTVDDMLLNIRMQCQNMMDLNTTSMVVTKSPTHAMLLPFKHRKHGTRSRTSSRVLESITESDECSSSGSSPRSGETDSNDTVNVKTATNEAIYGVITQKHQKLLKKQKEVATTLKSASHQTVELQQAVTDKTIERQEKDVSRINIVARNYSFDLEETSETSKTIERQEKDTSRKNIVTVELVEENKIGRFVPRLSSPVRCSETSSDKTTVDSQIIYNILRSVPITMKALNEVILLEDDEDLELQTGNVGSKIVENDIFTNKILPQQETLNKDNEKAKKFSEGSADLDREPSQKMNEENNIDEHVINQGIEEKSGQRIGSLKVKETLDGRLEFACDEEVIIIDVNIENQEITERVEGTNDDGINAEEQRNSNTFSEELSQNKKSKRYLKEISKSPQEVGKNDMVDEVVTNQNRKEKSKQPLTKNSMDKEKLLDDTYIKTEVRFPYGKEIIIILDDDIEDQEVIEKAEGTIEKGEKIEKIVDENSTSQNKEQKAKQLSTRSDNIEHHKEPDVTSSKLIQDEPIEQDVDNQEATRRSDSVSNNHENHEASLEGAEKDGISPENLGNQKISEVLTAKLQVQTKTNKNLVDGNVLESNVKQPTELQIIEDDKELSKNCEEFPNRDVTSQEVQGKGAVKSKNNKTLKSRETKKATNNVHEDDDETKLDKLKQTRKRTKRTDKHEIESDPTAVRRSARNVKKSPEKNANKEIVEEVSVGDNKQILSRDGPESSHQLLEKDLPIQKIIDTIESDDDIVNPTPPLPQTNVNIMKDKIISQKRIENIEVCGEIVSIECPSQLSGQSTILVEQNQKESNTNTAELSPISGRSTVLVSQQNAEEDEPANGNYEVFLSDGELEEETVKKPTHSARKNLDFTNENEDIFKNLLHPNYSVVYSYLQGVPQQTAEVPKLEKSEYTQKTGSQLLQKPVRGYVKPSLRLKRKLYNPDVESESVIIENVPSDSLSTETDGNDRAKKTKSKRSGIKAEENHTVFDEDIKKVKNVKRAKKAANKEPKKKTKLIERSIRLSGIENIADLQETMEIVQKSTEIVSSVTEEEKVPSKDSKDKENESDSLNEETTEMAETIRDIEKRQKAVVSKQRGTKNKLKDAKNKGRKGDGITEEKSRKAESELEDEVDRKLLRMFRSISDDSSDGTPQEIIVEATVHEVPLKYRETKTKNVVDDDNVQIAESISPIAAQAKDTSKENKHGQVEKILQTNDTIIEENEKIPPIRSQIEDAVKEKQQDGTNEKLLSKVSQPVDEDLIEKQLSDANQSTFDLLKESLNESDTLQKPRRKGGRKKITKSVNSGIPHGKVTKTRQANRSRRQLQDSLRADHITNDYISMCENSVKSYIDHCQKKALQDSTFVSKVENSILDNIARGGYEEHNETLPSFPFSNLSVVARKRKMRPLSSSDSEDDLQDNATSKRICILQNITLQKSKAANSPVFEELQDAENEDTSLYDNLISDSMRGIRALILLADRNIPQTDKWLKYHRMLKELKGIFKNYSDIC